MPFLPRAVSKVTVSPSRISSTKPLTWTKISSFEEESTMKPKPLVELKNFTVPVFIVKKEKNVMWQCASTKVRCFIKKNGFAFILKKNNILSKMSRGPSSTGFCVNGGLCWLNSTRYTNHKITNIFIFYA